MNELTKNSHCSYCGTRFTEQKLWPRKCFRCYNDSYSNPLPVVVVMIPVAGWYDWGSQRYGLLIQQRGIEPKKDQWALTGGYIDAGETWEQAAVREVREEIGLNLQEDFLKLWSVTSSTNKDNLLIFATCSYNLKDISKLNFQPNNEVLAIDVMWDERELAFPAHTEEANKFLRALKEKE